jgi:hypothetical protein
MITASISSGPHCFFTSFNKAYAAQALLLAESIRRNYGSDARIFAVIVDELKPAERRCFAEFDGILSLEQLGIPNLRHWLFGLDIVEAATAVKPFALCSLLREYPQVTYLDPDTYVFDRLTEVTDLSGDWDATLTPHQISPEQEKWAIEATELESLKYGVYNLGFISVRGTPNGVALAEWWRDRCYDYCVSDPERGLFTDQKFFDLAPALFSGVRVLRHPGYNVATWNLRERVCEIRPEGGVVNGAPLRFCHFTKATHIGAQALERMMRESSLFEELFFSYLARLREKNLSLSALDTRWAWGFYADGTPIEGARRKAFRIRKDRFTLPDPFLGLETPQHSVEA